MVEKVKTKNVFKCPSLITVLFIFSGLYIYCHFYKRINYFSTLHFTTLFSCRLMHWCTIEYLQHMLNYNVHVCGSEGTCDAKQQCGSD